MKRKIVSMLLAIMMLLGVISVTATETEGITVYLTVSKQGQIVSGNNETVMACVPVVLEGQEEYNLDDVFVKAHELYYPDENGYASSMGQYGYGIDVLWGDTSYNFGYQVNGGTESVLGVDFIVNDGDFVDAYIYGNPNYEPYSSFDSHKKEAYKGDAVSFNLCYVSGYEEAPPYAQIFNPLEGASIIVNDEETGVLTDENGNFEMVFEETGEYVISAFKNETVNDATVPGIIAPVCVVEVKENPVYTLIHNIAEAYMIADFEELGGNLPWVIADMQMYAEIFPESDFILSEERKADAFELLIDYAKVAQTPGDIAKLIIALSALGYDSSDIYTEEFEKINLPGKLTGMIDNEENSVVNTYTLPYVIIALSQGENYATEEQISYLINSAMTNNESWFSTQFGTDALTPMITALAPFKNDVEGLEELLAEGVEVLCGELREDGLIDGFEGYEAASTGLAICALSAMEMNCEEVTAGGENIIKGLLSTANSDLNGLPNAFATEQGFRGLLSWCLGGNGKTVYSFGDYEKASVNLSGIENCPVVFTVEPTTAEVEIEGFEQISDNVYDLPEGTYSYEITANKYKKQTGEFEVTADAVVNKEAIRISVELEKKKSGGGGGGGYSPVIDNSEKEPEETTENEKEEAVTETETDTKPGTEKEPEENPKAAVYDLFSDVEKDSWYTDAVQFACDNNLLKGTGEGFEPHSSMTRAMLVTVLFRYAKPENVTTDTEFSDISSDSWYAESVGWAVSNDIVNGVSETEFAPDSEITREQLAVILYRYAAKNGFDTTNEGSIQNFKDADLVSEYAVEALKFAVGKGLVKGDDSGKLNPGGKATRAEVSVILMRFVNLMSDAK